MKINILVTITALLICSVSNAVPPPCGGGSVSSIQQNVIKIQKKENALMGCGGNGGGSIGNGGWGSSNQNNYIGRYQVITTAPGQTYTYWRLANGTTFQQCWDMQASQQSDDLNSTVFTIVPGTFVMCHKKDY